MNSKKKNTRAKTLNKLGLFALMLTVAARLSCQDRLNLSLKVKQTQIVEVLDTGGETHG